MFVYKLEMLEGKKYKTFFFSNFVSNDTHKHSQASWKFMSEIKLINSRFIATYTSKTKINKKYYMEQNQIVLANFFVIA